MKRGYYVGVVSAALTAFGLYKFGATEAAAERKKEIVPGIVVTEKKSEQTMPRLPIIVPTSKGIKPAAIAQPSTPAVVTGLSQEELAELVDDDRQGALVQTVATFPEIEPVAEVTEISCKGKICEIEFESKTTNIDGKFQMAILHMLQKNQWIGTKMVFDTDKDPNGRSLRYVFSQQ